MKTHRTIARKSSAAWATILAAAFLLVACSGEEQKREYALPDTLCGTAVDRDALAPFLPTGSKIAVKDKSYSGSKGCQVVVDKKLIVTSAQMWMEEGRTTAFVAARQSLSTLDETAEDGRFVYSGNEAFGKTRGCVDTKYKQELYTVIQAEGSEYKDAKAMKRLIISFTEAVEKSAECTAGAL
ncbi:hypothetical protein JCM4814A_31740 [Streptomyces phaeofaciens JCM 4814]|uniref:Lipoprotein n=1 Tax=Streptomyces phaeofaciens TaxID=68254 RepID=A0A918HIC6_9ACTN|nr:hypothetical protein [Streptomyces phaeofaciens]GGT66741.1 hypothetical protein GCM10010226_50540 [Streptomyces phaeofaciens]